MFYLLGPAAECLGGRTSEREGVVMSANMKHNSPSTSSGDRTGYLRPETRVLLAGELLRVSVQGLLICLSLL